MLGLSVSGVKSRVQRGRAKIRSMFDECCEISLDCRGRVVQCDPRPMEEVPADCRAAAASWTGRRDTQVPPSGARATVGEASQSPCPDRRQ
jgi:hypothetical protein